MSDRLTEIPNSPQPTGGQGVVLSPTGKLPSSVLPSTADIAYVEFTSAVTIASVVEAAATQVVSSGTITYAASTPIWIEFFAPAVVAGGAGVSGGINLYDSGTNVGRLFDATIVAPSASGYDVPLGTLRRKLTPSAGSHTYKISAWNTGASNFIVEAGAGGAGVMMPGYIRIYKA